MIKKQHHHELERKNKTKPNHHTKFIEQQTGSDTPKKTSFKLRFIQWLKQLPLDERYLAVKVHAPGLSKKIQETLIDLQNEPFQQAKKDSSFTKRITPRQAKQIIESIVLISDGQDYFDNIGFDFTYIEHPDKLYQLLAMTLSQQQKLMLQTQQYQIETTDLKQTIAIVEKSLCKQQMTLAIISYLRSQIFFKYQQKRPIHLEQERNRKKQFSMFWRNLSEQYKKKILLLNRQDSKTLSTFLAQKKIFLTAEDIQKEINELIQMQKNQFCNKIFKCKLKKSLTYFTDYHELIYKLWKSQLNKRKRRTRNQKNINPQKSSTSVNRNPSILISQKPVRRTNNKSEKQQQKVESNIYRQKSKNNNVSLNIQKQKSSKNLSQSNSNQQSEKSSKTVSQSTIINQVNSNNDKNVKNSNQGLNLLIVPQSGQNNNNPPAKRKRNRNNRRKKSVSAQSKQTNTTNHKFQKQEKQEYERKIQEETSIASHEVIDTLPQVLLTEQTLPCTVTSHPQKSVKTIKPNKVQQITYPNIDFLTETYSKVKGDIQQYSDLINEQANEFYQRRVIAYERIQFMLGMWKIPIKLFGSCASGITIKNSDIDIAVDNSILNYFMHLSQSNRLRGALQQLEQLLQQQPWVTGLKLIKTAAIPLIKMKVDTSIKFIQIPGFQIYPAYLQAMNREHVSSGQIHIDLTIQTINKQLQCNHLGIISTDQINNWLKSIKCLHPIVIIIKNYLTKTNLNVTYEGGLNTYSMICMLVAFIKHNQLQEQTDTVKVFQQLIKFYAEDFDQKLTGIDLLNEKQIFYDKLKLTATKSATSAQEQVKLPDLTMSKSTTVFCKADLQIKDPLNNGKNMTKNCYSFPKIREIFKTIYQTCFIEQNKKLQTMFKQQYKALYLKSAKKQMLKQESKQVRQLLNQCKQKMSNPFLTLFE